MKIILLMIFFVILFISISLKFKIVYGDDFKIYLFKIRVDKLFRKKKKRNDENNTTNTNGNFDLFDYYTFNNLKIIVDSNFRIIKKTKFKKIKITVYKNSIMEILFFSSIIPIYIAANDLKIEKYEADFKFKNDNKIYFECIFTIKVTHIIYELIKNLSGLKKRGSNNGKTSNRKFNGIIYEFLRRND